MTAFDDWIERARAVPIEDELKRRGYNLKGKIEREGPCPRCRGTDRFSIKTADQVFNCRQCGVKGKGAITLVEILDGVPFLEACSTVTGEPPPKANKGDGKGNGGARVEWNDPQAFFDYDDRDGNLSYQNVRYRLLNEDGTIKLSAKGKPDKTFIQRHRNAEGKWINKRGDAPAIPYRLPQLLASLKANQTVPVFVVEGEKKADFLREKWGLTATSIAIGTKDFAEFFRDAHVVIVRDNDKTGEERATFVARPLRGIAASVRKLDLPDLDEGGDILDWAADIIGARETFLQLADAAPEWTPPPDPKLQQEQGNPGPLLKSSAEFIDDLVPPDYVIDGVVQRQFAYSLCAKTGAGKTTILLLIAAHIALGKSLGTREVAKGKVIFFAGENPTDVRMRWLALSISMGFDINTINVQFIDGVVKLSAIYERLKAEIQTSGEPVVAVFVDTKAAYFEGNNEDDNVQAQADAKRHYSLTQLPGGPCVIVPCHPPKNASEDMLIPRGGGAYVFAMDGNLVARPINDVLTEIHWQMKFRGVDFAPVTFQLHTVRHDHPKLKDTKGRLLPSVIATYVSDQEQERLVGVSDDNDTKLLTLIADNGKLSAREMAVQLGWNMANGEPYKSQVQRAVRRMIAVDKTVAKDGKVLRLSAAGYRAIGRTPQSRGRRRTNAAANAANQPAADLPFSPHIGNGPERPAAEKIKPNDLEPAKRFMNSNACPPDLRAGIEKTISRSKYLFPKGWTMEGLFGLPNGLAAVLGERGEIATCDEYGGLLILFYADDGTAQEQRGMSPPGPSGRLPWRD